MRLMEPDESCACGSGERWAECCGRALPLTLRYVPVRLLAPEDTVRTGCDRGGHCCRNVHVPLTPYDTVRLARQLDISTWNVLSDYAVVTAEGAVELDGTPECPFLDGSLCGVYQGRPDSCRSYPFWRLQIQDQMWLVERHTCVGCWTDCRSEDAVVADVVRTSQIDEGWQMDRLYQSCLQRLESLGSSDDAIEDFMTRAYDSDSLSFSTEEATLKERFSHVLERLMAEFSGAEPTGQADPDAGAYSVSEGRSVSEGPFCERSPLH